MHLFLRARALSNILVSKRTYINYGLNSKGNAYTSFAGRQENAAIRFISYVCFMCISFFLFFILFFMYLQLCRQLKNSYFPYAHEMASLLNISFLLYLLREI